MYINMRGISQYSHEIATVTLFQDMRAKAAFKTGVERIYHQGRPIYTHSHLYRLHHSLYRLALCVLLIASNFDSLHAPFDIFIRVQTIAICLTI